MSPSNVASGSRSGGPARVITLLAVLVGSSLLLVWALRPGPLPSLIGLVIGIGLILGGVAESIARIWTRRSLVSARAYPALLITSMLAMGTGLLLLHQDPRPEYAIWLLLGGLYLYFTWKLAEWWADRRARRLEPPM